MAARRSVTWPVASGIVALLVILLALPQKYRLWLPGFLQTPALHYGLDLAGGTQLDFRISEKEIEEQIAALKQELAEKEAQGASSETILLLQNQIASVEAQRQNLVEAIRTVLERRINALGVSEATITPSYIGDEKHLLVDCPGVVDTQECINTVGKTIQLEFKEEFTEPTEEYEVEVRGRVQEARARLNEPGMTLQKLGEDFSAEIGVSYQDEQRLFLDLLPKGLEGVWNRTPANGVLQYDGTVQVAGQDSAGLPTTTDVEGVFLVEVIQGRTQTGRLVNEASKAFGILADEDSTLSHETQEDREFSDAIPAPLQSALTSMQPGELRAVDLGNGTAGVIFLRRFVPGQTEMEASHILIAYKGASTAGEEVTRTKEEALMLATDLKGRLNAGENFETLARTYSDGPSRAEGGKLGTFGVGTMVPIFEQTVSTQTVGQVSDPVETQFGYHLIRTDKVPTLNPHTASYEMLTVTGENSATRASEIIAKMQNGEVQSMEDYITLRSIFFSLMPTGWKDTALDGKHFRAAAVTVDPTTNIPIVQITFDDEGGKLFQELTKNNIGKRIAIFVGGQLVSAPTVQQEITGGTAVITGSQNFDEANRLAQDLNTGAIPAPIYLSGQRTVEATLGVEALRTSVNAAIIGTIVLMLYMVLMYKMLGLLADIALAAYAVIFIVLLKLPLFLFSSTYVVLTLAGVAGILLSIGMAVDANVLIFERMREEMRKGKLFKTAAEIGFARAWPSIRDGNASTLITCAVLFVFGSSIVRGFALTLAVGLPLSMFTAIVMTRWLIRYIATKPIAERTRLFL